LNITHLTSVHPRNDTRIFYKMCISSSNDFNVTLIVADGLGDTYKSQVTIIDVGKASSILSRFVYIQYRLFRRALSLNSDIYHFHDPELIFVGLLLRLAKKIVIFDSHEDVPKQILFKNYFNLPIRKLISFFYSFIEKISCRFFSSIIGATPLIANKFSSINANVICIRNYPIIDMSLDFVDYKSKGFNICYVGALGKIRGTEEIVRSSEFLPNDFTIKIAGLFKNCSYEEYIHSLNYSNRVEFLGYINREEVYKVMTNSIAGLLILHPIPNYIDSLPVKLFEYMSAGIPVISSDFPILREIITNADCGILIDPLDVNSISNAISFLINNPKEASRLGKNGFDYSRAHFSWENEYSSLNQLYKSYSKQ